METRTISNRHIIWIAAGFVLLMFIAFTPTYFSPMVKGTFDGLPIFHLHGALFFAWPVLFLLQAILAEQGRLNLHRSLGLVGIVLATSMFFTGIAAVARDLRVNEYGLALIAFAGLIMFSLFVILALVYRKRREYHLRMAKAREAPPGNSRRRRCAHSYAFISAPGSGNLSVACVGGPDPRLDSVIRMLVSPKVREMRQYAPNKPIGSDQRTLSCLLQEAQKSRQNSLAPHQGR